MHTIQFISTPETPTAHGHYSQATVWGGLVFTAMQLPVRPDDPTYRTRSVVEQTHQALRNIERILRAAGSELSAVVRLTVYLTDIATWADVDRVCRECFDSHKPARGIVAVAGLHLGYNVAIEAISAMYHPKASE